MATDTLQLATFLLMITKRVRAGTRMNGHPDPRVALATFCAAYPDTPEAQMLTRIASAVVTGEGTFREADLYALSAESLAIASALIDAAIDGLS